MAGNGLLRIIGFTGYVLLLWGLVKLARTDGFRSPLIWALSGTVTVLTCNNLGHSSRTEELEGLVAYLINEQQNKHIEPQEQTIDNLKLRLGYLEKDYFNSSKSQTQNVNTLAQNDRFFQDLLEKHNSEINRLNNALSQMQSGLENQLSLSGSAASPPVQQSIDEETINLKLQQLESRVIAGHSRYIELIDSIIAQYHEHILISDRDESNNFLLRVLGGEPQVKNCNQFSEIEPAQSYLVMVCPWLSEYVFGTKEDRSYICYLIENLLKRGVEIHIGYGYLNHVTWDARKSKSVTADNYLELVEKQNQNNLSMHLGLEPLTELSKQYSNLKLKFMCSHEKYLICDGNFAVIGSHNFLSSVPSKYSVDRESAILTYDPKIVELLRQRYVSTEEIGKPILKGSRNR